MAILTTSVFETAGSTIKGMTSLYIKGTSATQESHGAEMIKVPAHWPWDVDQNYSVTLIGQGETLRECQTS